MKTFNLAASLRTKAASPPFTGRKATAAAAAGAPSSAFAMLMKDRSAGFAPPLKSPLPVQDKKIEGMNPPEMGLRSLPSQNHASEAAYSHSAVRINPAGRFVSQPGEADFRTARTVTTKSDSSLGMDKSSNRSLSIEGKSVAATSSPSGEARQPAHSLKNQMVFADAPGKAEIKSIPETQHHEHRIVSDHFDRNQFTASPIGEHGSRVDNFHGRNFGPESLTTPAGIQNLKESSARSSGILHSPVQIERSAPQLQISKQSPETFTKEIIPELLLEKSKYSPTENRGSPIENPSEKANATPFGREFQGQLVKPPDQASEIGTAIPRCQPEVGSSTPPTSAAPEIDTEESEPQTQSSVNSSSDSFSEAIKAETTPTEEEIISLEDESAPMMLSQRNNSESEALPGQSSDNGGVRSGGHSTKLETAAGGSTSSYVPVFYLSGKRIKPAAGTQPSKVKNGICHAATANRVGSPTPATNDQPIMKPDAPTAPGIKESLTRAPQAVPSQSAAIKMEYIRNLQELADKIQARALMMDGGREALLVKLNPPHLGWLRVMVETHGQEMHLTISADNPEAVQSLKEARGELAQVVSEQGYNLTRCDVDNQPSLDRRADGYTADQPGRNPTPNRREGERNAEPQTANLPPERHRPLDLGYNTLDLVA